MVITLDADAIDIDARGLRVGVTECILGDDDWEMNSVGLVNDDARVANARELIRRCGVIGD